MDFELSVVIPCYNEAFRLDRFFHLIRENIGLDWEWIFVDDGSTDDTKQRIEQFRKLEPNKIKLLYSPINQGKGFSVRKGILHCNGKLAGYVDADLAASPLHFQRYLRLASVRDGTVLVAGSRFQTSDGKVVRKLYRHLLGRIFQTYAVIVTGLKIYDSQCGFKLMATSRAKTLFKHVQCRGFAFDIELMLLAKLHGASVHEVSIPWTEQGASSIRYNHILQMIIDVWQLRNRSSHQDSTFIPQTVVQRSGRQASPAE